MAPAHVGVALALRRAVAEIAPAVDHLLGRAAADPELQPSAGDEVGRARVLGHVERVLVAHVDDRRADLDALGLRADRRQQRERRGELAGEMMDAEIGAVGAQLLGGDGEVDRLQQRVGRRARLRLRRGRPVPEREEADFFHGEEPSAKQPPGDSLHRRRLLRQFLDMTKSPSYKFCHSEMRPRRAKALRPPRFSPRRLADRSPGPAWRRRKERPTQRRYEAVIASEAWRSRGRGTERSKFAPRHTPGGGCWPGLLRFARNDETETAALGVVDGTKRRLKPLESLNSGAKPRLRLVLSRRRPHEPEASQAAKVERWPRPTQTGARAVKTEPNGATTL